VNGTNSFLEGAAAPYRSSGIGTYPIVDHFARKITIDKNALIYLNTEFRELTALLRPNLPQFPGGVHDLRDVVLIHLVRKDFQ
jgi:hypothetical protein